MVLLKLLALTVLILKIRFVETVDICDILDANYCFYFSDSSCYINLCQCEACSKLDKVQKLLESVDSSSNSTQERDALCPSWCGHLQSNETIVNILGATNNITPNLTEISFECADLKDNCLAKKGYNGHCYFYEKNCEYRLDVAKKGKSKNSHVPKTASECLKHQKKCSQKYKRHYSCKTFRKYCKKFDLPEVVFDKSNNSTTTQTQGNPLEQCLNFQRICAAKYRKHFACRQYRKKCKPFNLPEIHFEDSEVTQKSSHQHKSHMRRGHGMRHNETIVITDEISVGNETLVDTVLKRNE
ncbi:unnamed protein product [Caenorhabditis brenneri]